MMGKRSGAPGLFEFLEEADLPQYYHGLRNVLRVYDVPQLKYIIDEDLYSIGMSRPEARRLKVCFQKYSPQTYTSKLKKLLLLKLTTGHQMEAHLLQLTRLDQMKRRQF